jgi:ketopantoate hydroxymethyltransferase
MVTDAMKAYAAEVRGGDFPGDEHCYKMIEGEEEKFIKLIES